MGDPKPEFKNRRHKTKKDRKDRDGINNRRRPPPVATTDLVSIAGGGIPSTAAPAAAAEPELTESGRKRKRNNSGQSHDSADSHDLAASARNGVQIISKDPGDQCTAPPKLIIRFGKKPVPQPQQPQPQQPEDISPPPPLQDPSAIHRLMPIKLKLARCSQGYVTKSKSDSTPP